MSRKKHAYIDGGTVFHMSSEEATLSKMPKYNAFGGGYGAHGSKKYDRKKADREFKKMIDGAGD